MDRVGFVTLQAECREDCRLAMAAAKVAADRYACGTDAGLEAAAFHLARFFNIVEQMSLRVAKAFENHIDRDHGWHAQLLRRLSIAVPGIRPALFTPEFMPWIHDLRGFRHIVNHAYDLKLERARCAHVLENAEKIAATLPGLLKSFMAQVGRENGWNDVGE